MRGASQLQASERLRPTDRIKKRVEYRRVQLQGRRLHTRHFLIVLHRSSRGAGRVGITVTKKVGNAVTRNRIKRLVREVYRRNRPLFPEGYDVVFIAKRNAADLGYESVLSEVEAATAGGRLRAEDAGQEARP